MNFLKGKNINKLMLYFLLCLIILFIISLGVKEIKNNKIQKANEQIAIEKEELIQELYELYLSMGLSYDSIDDFKNNMKLINNLDLGNMTNDEIKNEIDKSNEYINNVNSLKDKFDVTIKEKQKEYETYIYNNYVNKGYTYTQSNKLYIFNINNIEYDSCYCTLDDENNEITKMSFLIILNGFVKIYKQNNQQEGSILIDMEFDVKTGEQYINGILYGYANGATIGIENGTKGTEYGSSIKNTLNEKFFATYDYSEDSEFSYFIGDN